MFDGSFHMNDSEGLTFPMIDFKFQFSQPTDSNGVPRDVVRCDELSITLEVRASFFQGIMEWATDHRMRRDGLINFTGELGEGEWQKIEFKDAFCVYFYEHYSQRDHDQHYRDSVPYQPGQFPTRAAAFVTIKLSGMTLIIDDRYIIPGPGYNANNNNSSTANSGTGGAMGDDDNVSSHSGEQPASSVSPSGNATGSQPPVNTISNEPSVNDIPRPEAIENLQPPENPVNSENLTNTVSTASGAAQEIGNQLSFD